MRAYNDRAIVFECGASLCRPTRACRSRAAQGQSEGDARGAEDRLRVTSIRTVVRERLCDLPPPVRRLARLLPWDSCREMHRAVTDRGACKSDPGREQEFRHHAPRLHALSAPRSVAHHSYHPWVIADAKPDGMVNGDPSPLR
jgi:hypothetical protein